MKYPNFLKENGTIGFVAPSFGCYIEPYRTAFGAAQEKFKKLGHKLDLGPNCYEGSGIGISNTPSACGEELTQYYTSSENDVLISCGGGELMCEVLDFVDFEKIKQATPKWYMGFSDNTNMTFLLATICDTASIYGPCAATFGMNPWHQAVQDAYDLLCGKKFTMEGYPLWEKESLKSAENPFASYNVTEEKILCYYLPEIEQKQLCNEKQLLKEKVTLDTKYFEEDNLDQFISCEETLNSATMEGRLLGGCVDCLVTLLGTYYDKVKEFQEKYKEDGIIWFLECCDLNVMSMRRAFWQMEHAGWFQYTKGFLIGRPMHYQEDMMGLDQYSAVYEVVKKYQVPVIMDVDLGHLPPAMPFLCGAKANVRAKGNDISIKYILD